MGHGLRIGRVFGIELRVDPSWVFIFALISWSLTALFSGWHPDWSLAESIGVAVVASLVFFVSVLLHELAHSLVARLYGVPVRDITLHLFGGVSNIEREPPTPGAELLIAVVGPLASVLIGVVMLVLGAIFVHARAPDAASAAAAISRLGPIGTLLAWLGPVNILVGLFNLLPGFPLDGGRVLRAIVWKATGDLHKATRVAGGAGQLLGWAFVALGVLMAVGVRVPFFGRGLTPGLWLALIGLFLRNAAATQLRGAAMEEALAGVRVLDLMRPPTFVDAHLGVRTLVEQWFMRQEDTAYPVVDEAGAFVGIVSVDDVPKAGKRGRGDWESRTVADVMTPRSKLVTTSPDEELVVALRKLGAAGVRQLPVLDQGGLAGVLFEKDVARWLELHGPMGGGAGRPAHGHA